MQVADCYRAWPLIADGTLSTKFCCDSCHEDAELGAEYPLAEVTLPDGTQAEVCCAVQRSLLGEDGAR